MRTDFREERKWKLAVAYTLAHAVVEWHEAGTLEERVRRGICVLWSPEDRNADETQVEHSDFGPQDMEIDGVAESKGDSTPANDDNSDDDSEEEQEKDRQAVLSALEPSSLLQDALEEAENGLAASQDIEPKTEEVEDSSALQLNALVEQAKVDADAPSASAGENVAPSGLKAGAGDTMLTDTSTSVAITAPALTKSKSKSAAYGHLREQIIYSDVDKLFLDLDDFELVRSMSDLTTADDGTHHVPAPTDISAIFPDLQPYGLLDVPPTSTVNDGKKKDRRGDKDDPTKRADDTTYTKVVPLSRFMLKKMTLLGPLEPSKHWHDGHWFNLDDTTVAADFDSPSGRSIDDSIICCEFSAI
jgi:chromatin modification-related protein VID21